jgi:hypothetical protein
VRRRPEHERAFLVAAASRRLTHRVHGHAVPPGGGHGQGRQSSGAGRDRLRLLRRGRDIGRRVLRSAELRRAGPAPRVVPRAKQRIRDQRSAVGPDRLRDPHDRQGVQGPLGRGRRHSVHRDVQEAEAARRIDARRLRAAARRSARRADRLALVLRRPGEVPHRGRARRGEAAGSDSAHLGARAFVGPPRRAPPERDARRDQGDGRTPRPPPCTSFPARSPWTSSGSPGRSRRPPSR